MIGIVESRADDASERICEQLRRIGEFEERTDTDLPEAAGGGTVYRSEAFELRSFDDLHLELDDVAETFDDPAFLVFASRHAGDTGPLLSAHVTGNFGDAEYGGANRSLARAPPNALAAVVDRLAVHAPEAYDVSLECTHHGPTEVGAPSMFVELGSGPDEWTDDAGAAAVARAILDLAETPADGPIIDAPAEGAGAGTHCRHVVGFGGGHYAPRFTRIARETDWAVGHVAANWSLDELGAPSANADVIQAAFEQSRATHAVVEGNHPRLTTAIEDLGHRVVSETWVQETTGVSLPIVEELEERLCSVDDGLRFGAPARENGETAGDASGTAADARRTAPEATSTGQPSNVLDDAKMVELPSELLEAATNVDREATMTVLSETALAFETTEGGTRPGDRGCFPGEGISESVVEGLATILRERYDSLTVEADRIVAEETAFDPALASEAGVPEGPAFGKLSAGETVEVDGQTVEPTDVHEQREVAFELSSRTGADDE
ncbi:D-aminoacyl-tRNA deacylase [Salinarchaeum laminariae]|uniref:D-aminoacyl-tRNA deacylase n=1 Tax=Salinarchaeum laminariae TaxID=869888 RepID=UPI0020C10E2A|nr:D-aminoacyl-tRNA deacylase [Salinarchaeum laminariae]